MSFGRAIAQTVEGIPGVIAHDQMTEQELQALADTLRATLRAVDDELLARIIARCGRLPVSYAWPAGPGGDAA